MSGYYGPMIIATERPCKIGKRDEAWKDGVGMVPFVAIKEATRAEFLEARNLTAEELALFESDDFNYFYGRLPFQVGESVIGRISVLVRALHPTRARADER